MTTNERRPGVPDGPPWSVDLIADLHAGVLDPAVAAQLRPRIEADPEARAVLAALDETQAELAALPPLRMPEHVASRIEAAIENEVRLAMAARPGAAPLAPSAPPQVHQQPQQLAPVVDLAAARRRRTRAIGWGIGALAGLAAATGLIFAVLPGQQPVTGTAQPTSVASTPGDGVLALKSADLDGKIPPGISGNKDYGPFSDQAKLKACLLANNQPGHLLNPVAGRQVTVDGKPGVALVLLTATPGRTRLLVVGADCAAGKPSLIKDSTVG
ncbi:hypothetical protein N8J89_41615 [Crossiella sp. CA-258035]|uniref:anti-sigma factor family protein n=1 Tax=Crossiella sp. CA-258035 TaxID=2981138 RepID=UPI0024BCCA1A|nr:hypothetical protein [Crossiella sp. CA-258035]WHT19507.1 hypothetical protein N8J89_41615 [Crossiella sp. CA-258035]